ncbi:glycosyltransferase [Algoriphagus sp. SE2]|uniref:glycosyltransferase n=1 Tax=Algoriphagus sp. SE2 TaxID=3141536 RepID=UPI0031CD928A
MNLIGVSVIICTYNGRNRLKKTIDHLLNQNPEFDFEIILVDNASKDDTAEWVISYLQKFPDVTNFRIIEESRPGLNHARITGFRASSFDLILFCDDDNWLAPDFLTIGSRYLNENPKAGVLGSLGIPVFEIEKPEWFSDFSHTYAVGSLGKKPGIQPVGSFHYGAACFFRKTALEKLEELGFESFLSDRKGKGLNSGGDVELCLAVQLVGYELHFDDRLTFKHFIETHRLNWNYYLKLKEGISSSFPILESYKVHEFSELNSFKKHLWKNYFIILKGVIKSNLLGFFSSENLNQVNRVTTKTKLFSFFKNYNKTLEAFRANQKLFNA